MSDLASPPPRAEKDDVYVYASGAFDDMLEGKRWHLMGATGQQNGGINGEVSQDMTTTAANVIKMGYAGPEEYLDEVES